MARARIRVEGGWRRSAGVFGGDDVGLQWLLRARWRERRSKRCSRTELVRVCGDVQLAGWRVSGGRAPSGGERQRSESSEGATELGFPGPTLGQMQSGRRAERVSLPAMEKKRRRRVLVVTICSPRPMRAVQRARLWAITCTASQAPFGRLRIGGEAARGEMCSTPRRT